jgi:hypothetical protein
MADVTNVETFKETDEGSQTVRFVEVRRTHGKIPGTMVVKSRPMAPDATEEDAREASMAFTLDESEWGPFYVSHVSLRTPNPNVRLSQYNHKFPDGSSASCTFRSEVQRPGSH